ncbi:hypothetical protein AAKU61_003840 [Undibacterium sp. GrIS 1.2]
MAMEFDGHKLPVPELLASKVNRNEKYPEILSALGFTWGECISMNFYVSKAFFIVYMLRL